MEICGIEVPEEIVSHILSYNVLPYTKSVNSTLFVLEDDLRNDRKKYLLERYGDISRTYWLSDDKREFIFLLHISTWFEIHREMRSLPQILVNAVKYDREYVIDILTRNDVGVSFATHVCRCYSGSDAISIAEKLLSRGLLEHREVILADVRYWSDLLDVILPITPMDKLVDTVLCGFCHREKQILYRLIDHCESNIEEILVVSIMRADPTIYNYIVEGKPLLDIDIMIEKARVCGCEPIVMDFLKYHGYV
jgi:hypothetical protein